MRFILLSFVLLVSSLTTETIPAKKRLVILVSLDGFPAYALDDPRLPVPNLRRLAREGTVAQRMKTINPTVTWPNHTSMVTGVSAARHGVLYNGLPVRATPDEWKIESRVDKTKLVQVPTVYDLAHAAGLTTAEVNWVAISHASTISWSFPERPDLTDNVVQEMISTGQITNQDIAEFAQANVAWRDEVWTLAAIHIVKKHRPNLLLLHLLNTDSVHHRYGPRNLASTSALALADARLGQLYRALAAVNLLDCTTLLVVSDHGFKIVRKNIQPNIVLRNTTDVGKVQVIPEGGTAMVYVHGDTGKAERVTRLIKRLSQVEGIERVFTPDQYDLLGLPQPATNERSPDLVLAAKDGYAFTAGAEGTEVIDLPAPQGSHGYLNTDPEMDALFLASGYGIKKGMQIESVRNIDIAPSIAALLGLKMNNIDGRVLSEILR